MENKGVKIAVMQRWGESPLALEDGCTSAVLPGPSALALKTDQIGVNSDSTTYWVCEFGNSCIFSGFSFYLPYEWFVLFPNYSAIKLTFLSSLIFV